MAHHLTPFEPAADLILPNRAQATEHRLDIH
jgi:hypothetical protein